MENRAALRFRGGRSWVRAHHVVRQKKCERRRWVTYRLVCRLCRSCHRRVGPRGDCVRAGARTRACLCTRGRVEGPWSAARPARKRRREIAIAVAVAVARRTRWKARPRARWNRPPRRTWGEGGRRNHLPSYWTCVMCVSNSRLGRGAACVVMPASRPGAATQHTRSARKRRGPETSRRSSRSNRWKRIGEPRETSLRLESDSVSTRSTFPWENREKSRLSVTGGSNSATARARTVLSARRGAKARRGPH